MKHVIIPTDLSVKSLSVIHPIVKKNAGTDLCIHVIHIVRTPADITDLLFLSKTRLYSQVPVYFYEALQALNYKYANSNKIHFEIYYGNKPSVLNSIVENLAAKETYLLADYSYSEGLKHSVNMLRFFNKAKLPVYRIGAKNEAPRYGEVNLLSTLLGTEIKTGKARKPAEVYPAS